MLPRCSDPEPTSGRPWQESVAAATPASLWWWLRRRRPPPPHEGRWAASPGACPWRRRKDFHCDRQRRRARHRQETPNAARVERRGTARSRFSATKAAARAFRPPVFSLAAGAIAFTERGEPRLREVAEGAALAR